MIAMARKRDEVDNSHRFEAKKKEKRIEVDQCHRLDGEKVRGETMPPARRRERESRWINATGLKRTHWPMTEQQIRSKQCSCAKGLHNL
jgi:hypothetical protein